MEDNIKYLSREEIHEILLNIMQHFHDVCEKNDIYYVMSSGSCLGAVRHKGFIPWDDDVDVFVPRSDYGRMLKALSEASERYKPMDYTINESYYYPFAKLVDTFTAGREPVFVEIKDYGVYIDIFPVDGLPDDPKARKKHIRSAMRTSMLVQIKNAIHTDNPLKNLVKRTIGCFFRQ